ncbi:MAG: hypothetical protein MUF87_16425 [Anaerolineae bacterium]|jgi:hypothetical protein|nr:hypothetical protein [Anaerolineae bacterium]
MSSNELDQEYRQATLRTAGSLMNVATTQQIMELSQLTLPEVSRITDEVARVIPAGNVPGMILSGLTRLEGRTVESNESKKNIGMLFKGVRVTLGKAMYSALFAGPAAVLYGYQMLMRLAGKDTNTAFPEGTWQFYLECALREDSARHSNETTGFHHSVGGYPQTDQLAAWLITIANTVKELPDLLKNEWRERMLLQTLAETAHHHRLNNAAFYDTLYPQWEKQRPYRRDSVNETYASFRYTQFELFWHPHAQALSRAAREDFERRFADLQAERLAAYQRQMSWLAYLKPDLYNETRIHYDYDKAMIGVIWHGRYYLFPLLGLLDTATARRVASAILKSQPTQDPAAIDDLLVRVPREHQTDLRAQLAPNAQEELAHLAYVPVMLNWDQRDVNHPLAFIRQGKRGIGDHALTIFRTQDSFVFDQSHIFFDGAGGAAIAQILTNEAILWADRIAQTTLHRGGSAPNLYSPLLATPPKIANVIKKIPTITPEASAENQRTDLALIQSLRKLLKQRSDDLSRITVNDLLILYRGMHALRYEPSERLQREINQLGQSRNAGAQKALQAIRESLERLRAKNPAIMIPIDASRHDPRERVYPTTFWNPITDFAHIHDQTVNAWQNYQLGGRKDFEKLQAQYLSMIGGFAQLLSKYKEIALRGESASTLSIKSLAHLPPALQQLFANLPSKFDLLNEIIKGEEVFSNIGRVAPGSTLRRFITAKDDNAQKTFCWGVITDDRDVVHFTLRDFRPHVRLLQELGYAPLAQLMVQDYLDSYVIGLNQYMIELREITVAGKRTTTGFLRNIFGGKG